MAIMRYINKTQLFIFAREHCNHVPDFLYQKYHSMASLLNFTSYLWFLLLIHSLFAIVQDKIIWAYYMTLVCLRTWNGSSLLKMGNNKFQITSCNHMPIRIESHKIIYNEAHSYIWNVRYVRLSSLVSDLFGIPI